MKMSELHRTKFDEDDEDASDDDDDLDEDAVLNHATIPHDGGVNRVRVRGGGPPAQRYAGVAAA